MKKRNQRVKIGVSTEEKINKEFIGAWKKAEKGKSFKTKEHIYFLDASTLFPGIKFKQKLILQLNTPNLWTFCDTFLPSFFSYFCYWVIVGHTVQGLKSWSISRASFSVFNIS